MIALLVSMLAVGPQGGFDQRAAVPEGTTINSVDVSGFDLARLSPGLRQDIRALAGTALSSTRLDELAARIEAERPRHVAAVRVFTDTAGQTRVVFIVGLRGEVRDDENVNARYIVEHAEITGVPDKDVSQALRDDLQALAGHSLDSDEAERVRDRITRELPRYEVRRRIRRGSESGRLRVVYEASEADFPRWLRYEPLRANLVYHSAQKWGSFLDLGIGGRDLRFTPIVAIADGDDLVEEFSGFGLRVETRRLGTRRLGASLEWSTFDPKWHAPTRDALAFHPEIPALYDTRNTVTPLVKFAFTPELTLAAGVAVTELEGLEPATDSTMANAAIGALDYVRKWTDGGGGSHELQSQFELRAGSRSLESDLAYERYLADGAYVFDLGRHHLVASGMAGRINGSAPLFERFTLGDSRTLRGWDKYDIAPAGASRVFYASLEYGYSGVSVFLDAGSLWDGRAESRVRVSSGIGFHAGPAFASVGFPLNTDNFGAVFTMGIRFAEGKNRW
jgi:hypothetical protein